MKEQKQFTASVCTALQEGGVKINWLLKQIGMTAQHWDYIRKGERVLTDKKKNKILEALKIRRITLETTKP